MNVNLCLVAVIIPCFKVEKHILDVIAKIGPEVHKIYVVDDYCPSNSGKLVELECKDPRITIIRHSVNMGVGGAVISGYLKALEDGCAVMVKVDGDGQMDPSLIGDFIAPILAGEADYTKGNRFYDLEKVRAMPKMRLLGNAGLSFMAKISSGYWDLFDPTNGFTAIHSEVASHLPFEKISKRYFFETDMLFRLNTFRAVVIDVPMDAKYEDEVSNLKISKVAVEFFLKHLRNTFKRIFYNYYLRDMSLASLELPLGAGLILFGSIYGGYHWVHSAKLGITTAPGIVMLSALPIILGIQFLLAFLGQDIRSMPTRPFNRKRMSR